MLVILLIITVLALNLLALLTIKSRVSIIIFITSANLFLILLYSLTLDNQLLLKELSLATIIYCMIISFLIISYKQKSLEVSTTSYLTKSIFAIITIICTLSSFHIMKNLNQKLVISKELSINRLILSETKPIPEKSYTRFKQLKNISSTNQSLFSRFGEFLIIFCASITFLFLSIKHTSANNKDYANK